MNTEARRVINRRPVAATVLPERQPSPRALKNEARARRLLATWERKLILAAGRVAQFIHQLGGV